LVTGAPEACAPVAKARSAKSSAVEESLLPSRNCIAERLRFWRRLHSANIPPGSNVRRGRFSGGFYRCGPYFDAALVAELGFCHAYGVGQGCPPATINGVPNHCTEWRRLRRCMVRYSFTEKTKRKINVMEFESDRESVLSIDNLRKRSGVRNHRCWRHSAVGSIGN
jgi:hypothetical protein